MPLAPILLEAHNPSPMTGRGNNTYLMIGDGSAVLVDAGIGHPDHLDAIGHELAERRAGVTCTIVTHGHADHASGAPHVAARHPNAVFRKFPLPGDEARNPVPWVAANEGDEILVGGEALTVLHTPGHAPDHIALWHESSRSVFGGDLVVLGSSVTIDVAGGGSLEVYLASLSRLLALEPRRLYPAHGPLVEDPQALLRAYLDHRLLREQQVMAALTTGHVTVEAIAESIYDGLAPALAPAARENVRAHLQKLKNEGRAVDRDGRWVLFVQ
jgi:glyoxylase-like metal-dependent hydrolase (beta-lactamase superfamily II)